jgi:hypothetical protein
VEEDRQSWDEQHQSYPEVVMASVEVEVEMSFSVWFRLSVALHFDLISVYSALNSKPLLGAEELGLEEVAAAVLEEEEGAGKAVIGTA